jgi:hypothetical protein
MHGRSRNTNELTESIDDNKDSGIDKSGLWYRGDKVHGEARPFLYRGFQRLQETKRFMSAVLGSLVNVTGLYIVFYCGFEGVPMVRCGLACSYFLDAEVTGGWYIMLVMMQREYTVSNEDKNPFLRSGGGRFGGNTVLEVF